MSPLSLHDALPILDARRCLSRWRAILLLLFLGVLLRLVDFLRQAAGIAAGADRRALSRAGAADSHQLVRFASPRLPLLPRALWILRLRQAVPLALRRTNADVLAWARIVPIDRQCGLPGLSECCCRNRGHAGTYRGGARKNGHQPGHRERVLSTIMSGQERRLFLKFASKARSLPCSRHGSPQPKWDSRRPA